MAEKNAPTVLVGSLSLGVTVIVLYALFVSLVTFGFGSYIYRTGWQVDASAGIAPDGPTLSSQDIDSLLFILKREQDLNRAKQRLTVDLQALRGEVTEFDSLVAQSFTSIAHAKAALQAEVDSTMADLIEFQYALPGPGRSKFESVVTQMDLTASSSGENARILTADYRVRTLMTVAASEFETAGGVDLDTKERFVAMQTRATENLDRLATAVGQANAGSHDIQAQRKAVMDKVDELQGRWDGFQAEVLALQETLPPGNPSRARLSALSLNIPWFPDVLMRLVSFPTIFLTLIVTIAAGGLGTVVAFSRRYYSSKHSDQLTLSRLFVNVGEGIAAAIAIFLFSGAGMLALTQGSGPANDVELSPYTVAFIAFLSGFMAEDAFASIQSAGKRIFQPEKQAEKAAESEAEKAEA
ncbi:hypothetical protein [uncultured Tateyamaria sp.]|uniref:hypothetical protein n=1 Tax=uncultured Tateyamaria sp. TaxID=455651 RepID=UPI0026087D30|nr:hypothetical protein [uncultured Tateyamaria sp.]